MRYVIRSKKTGRTYLRTPTFGTHDWCYLNEQPDVFDDRANAERAIDDAGIVDAEPVPYGFAYVPCVVVGDAYDCGRFYPAEGEPCPAFDSLEEAWDYVRGTMIALHGMRHDTVGVLIAESR